MDELTVKWLLEKPLIQAALTNLNVKQSAAQFASDIVSAIELKVASSAWASVTVGFPNDTSYSQLTLTRMRMFLLMRGCEAAKDRLNRNVRFYMESL